MPGRRRRSRRDPTAGALALYAACLGAPLAMLLRHLTKRGKARGTKAGAERPKRVYMDGCFDMMHAGHAYALRQAYGVCSNAKLVVGVVGDEEIEKAKGCAPVIPEHERAEQVRLLRWVDEVVTDVPYNLSKSFLSRLFGILRADVVVHGDDPCLLPDGTDAYAEVKRMGRYAEVPRTEGISSTDIIGRILRATSNGPFAPTSDDPPNQSTLLLTAARIEEFANPRESLRPTALDTPLVVGYVDGAFDTCHVGHGAFLALCREQCDVLLVGCHDDKTVSGRRLLQRQASLSDDASEEFAPLPLLTLHERCLALMAQRAVSDVIIGAPAVITEDMLATLRIRKVFRGTVCEGGIVDEKGRFQLPRRRGFLRVLPSPFKLTTRGVVRRVLNRRAELEQRYAAKSTAEASYYAEKSQQAQQKLLPTKSGRELIRSKLGA